MNPGRSPVAVPGDPPRYRRIIGSLQERHPYPLSVHLSLTERCNLRCRHCLHPPQTGPRSELALDQILRILDQLSAAGVLFLTLTGGEVALRPELETIVGEAVKRRFHVKLKTNGTLLPPARVTALVESGLREIHVSLYDDRPEAHDEFVGQPGAWERSLQAMRRFVDHGCMVLAAVIVTRHNAGRISRIVDLCEAEGFSYQVDGKIAPRTDGDASPTEHRATDGQLVQVLSDRRLLDPNTCSRGSADDGWDGLCNAGTSLAYIRADGRLLLCPGLPHELGDLTRTSFETAWQTSPALAEFRSIRRSDATVCSTCAYAWACDRCPSIALAETGDLTGVSSIDCALARAKAALCRRDPP